MNEEALENKLKEAKKYCTIPVKDAEDMLNNLQDPDFLGLERISPWEFSSIPILNYNGKVHNFSYCRANFSCVNKWRYKQPYKYFMIIYSDDFYVTWVGNVLTSEPVFWVSVDNTVYRLTYSHKRLLLYPNICSELELVTGFDQVCLDKVVKKYYKLLRVFDPNFIMLEHETGYKTIVLDTYFPKGFFYKGPKYNYSEYKKVNYYAWIGSADAEKKEISEIKNVITENDLFKIEIENQTYPHTGYVYLDLEKVEIAGAEWD